MRSDFAGTTAQYYAEFRRDLPADQTDRLVAAAGLRATDVAVDLGCGTGQLAAPLAPHCAAVVAIDPEPDMLAGLRARHAERVVCVLGDDSDLPVLAIPFAAPIGLVTIGNALHWMDERATLGAAAALLRPGGAIAVVTQGPPLWLGPAPWQRTVRSALESLYGPVTGNCRTDRPALDERRETAASLGLGAEVLTWQAAHHVTLDWVLGHLGSALGAEQLTRMDELRDLLRPLAGEDLVEEVTTTVLLARRS
ncbi:class I SAM-dependent methyltransferase [Leifsonia shinshuensis]|uniref:Methyltransferase domain-containing protein n=1 Tax=Leifsonia shinshuensis TaxID=150026 RepID=A0A7G6YFQ2_9MICO|nr:class I SAM-dependent methyltransferase [Leifsonia shinshuensis]QNE37317.1 methyltransferase domain-containing protein [Leifsonia shinshuensis]